LHADRASARIEFSGRRFTVAIKEAGITPGGPAEDKFVRSYLHAALAMRGRACKPTSSPLAMLLAARCAGRDVVECNASHQKYSINIGNYDKISIISRDRLFIAMPSRCPEEFVSRDGLPRRASIHRFHASRVTE